MRELLIRSILSAPRKAPAPAIDADDWESRQQFVGDDDRRSHATLATLRRAGVRLGSGIRVKEAALVTARHRVSWGLGESVTESVTTPSRVRGYAARRWV